MNMRHLIPRIVLTAICVLAFAQIVIAATSTHKGYDLQATGSNRGLWGVILNNNFQIIDKNLGGRVSDDVAGSVDVSVTSTDAQNIYHKLTGILTGDIEYVVPDAGAVFFIENATTGDYTVTVTNAIGGTGVLVPQGDTMLIYSNATDNEVVEGITFVSGTMFGSNNLSDVSSAATAFSNIKQAASESATGVVELATTAEASAGSDTARAVTAAGVSAAITALAPEVPAGSVIFFASTGAPDGYLQGYGQAVSRSTYDDLFAAIGTAFGSGDGSTTFNLPDCRGRVIAGEDDMGGSSANRLTNQSGGLNGDTLGDTGGAETHTLTVAQVPSLTVSVPYYTTNSSGSTELLTGDSTATQQDSLSLSTSGGGGAHNNVQPTIVMGCIVKT